MIKKPKPVLRISLVKSVKSGLDWFVDSWVKSSQIGSNFPDRKKNLLKL
jgi:hypothetical protein